jgi:hypothetical protein
VAGGGGAGGGVLPTFNVKVAAPDVDMGTLTEEEEETVGVWLAKEGTRKAVTVNPVQCRLGGTQQILSWSSARVSLWTAATGGSILPGGSKSLSADQGCTYYAQGDAASGSLRDSEVAASYTVGGKTAQDRVKLTVVDAEIAPFDTIPLNTTNDVNVTLSPNPPGTNITLHISLLGGTGAAVFAPSGGTTSNITNSTTVKIKGVTASSAASNMVLRAMLGSDVLASNLFAVAGTEIIEVGFTGDHMTRRWTNKTDIDTPDGTVPVWRKVNNPDDPVCWTTNAAPAMFALFTNVPAIGEPIAGVKVRARVGTNVIGSASGVTLSGGSTAVTGIGGGSAIPGSDGVKTLTPTLTWELSYDDGVSWQPAGSSGAHTMHFIMGSPNETPLYDRALEKACGYAAGAGNPTNVAAGIRSGIYGAIGSRYSGLGTWYPRSGVELLELYDTSDDLICGTYANLTANLCRSVGLTASTVYVWAGFGGVGFIWRYTVTDKWGTILIDPGGNVWSWHAVASTPEYYSDSSLNVRLVDIVHIHPSGTSYFQDAGDIMWESPPIDFRIPEGDPEDAHQWP